MLKVHLRRHSPWSLWLTGRRYYFKLQWPLLIIVISLTMTLVSLGLWQRDRGYQKQRLYKAFNSRSRAPAAPWRNISHPKHFQKVKLHGHYDARQTMLLDNQFFNHRPGYHVLTPWVLTGKQAVLVDRGWVPKPFHGGKPKLIKDNGASVITGLITPLKQRAITLGPVYNHNDTKPLRIQALKPAVLNQLTGYDLSRWMVLLEAERDRQSAYVKNWQPHTLPPSRHFSYSWQWFMFAIVLVVGYITANTHKRLNADDKK